MTERAAEVTQRLANTWTNWWTFSMWTGLGVGRGHVARVLVVFALLDALLHLSQVSLGVLFALWATLTAAAIGLLFHRLLRFQRSLSATARRVELEFPEVGSHHQPGATFSAARLGESGPFRDAAVAQAAEAGCGPASRLRGEKMTRWRRFVLCMQTPRDLGERRWCWWAWRLSDARGRHGPQLVEFDPAAHEPLGVRAGHRFRDLLQRTATPRSSWGRAWRSRPRSKTRARQTRRHALPWLPDGGPETSVAMHADKESRTFVAALPQVVGPARTGSRSATPSPTASRSVSTSGRPWPRSRWCTISRPISTGRNSP